MFFEGSGPEARCLLHKKLVETPQTDWGDPRGLDDVSCAQESDLQWSPDLQRYGMELYTSWAAL